MQKTDYADRRDALSVALAKAGADEQARRIVVAECRQLCAQAENLGSGFAVCPAKSMGLAKSAAHSFFGFMPAAFRLSAIWSIRLRPRP